MKLPDFLKKDHPMDQNNGLTAPASDTSLESLRRQILNRVFIVASILGAAAYLINLPLVLQKSNWVLLGIYTLLVVSLFVITFLRRISYNLRPPALDELGLLGALREHLASAQQHDGLRFVLENPETLPPLPAAVEVAAYRIIIEAVTNVQRHAEASICTVKIELDEHSANLSLEVIDNGRGISTQRPAGVGLTAMRERTAELGGQFLVNSAVDGGTHIQARLPVYTAGSGK